MHTNNVFWKTIKKIIINREGISAKKFGRFSKSKRARLLREEAEAENTNLVLSLLNYVLIDSFFSDLVKSLPELEKDLRGFFSSGYEGNFSFEEYKSRVAQKMSEVPDKELLVYFFITTIHERRRNKYIRKLAKARNVKVLDILPIWALNTNFVDFVYVEKILCAFEVLGVPLDREELLHCHMQNVLAYEKYLLNTFADYCSFDPIWDIEEKAKALGLSLPEEQIDKINYHAPNYISCLIGILPDYKEQVLQAELSEISYKLRRGDFGPRAGG